MDPTNPPVDNGGTGSPDTQPKRYYLSNTGIVILGSYMAIVGFALIQNLCIIWPGQPDRQINDTGYKILNSYVTNTLKSIASGDSSAAREQALTNIEMVNSLTKVIKENTLPADSAKADSIHFKILFIPIGKKAPRGNSESVLILITLIVGAIGSWLHATSSFIAFVGNREFITSWIPWYVIRPMIGAVLALIFYVVIRAGLTNSSGVPAELSYFSVAAFAGLVGLFTERATKKLGEVFDVVFAVQKKDKDPITSKKPELTRLEPSEVKVGAKDTTIKLVGANFVEDSKVFLNDKKYDSSTESESEITILLKEADLKTVQEIKIKVVNPGQEGEASNEKTLNVIQDS
ncbi:MAG: hypothetical protein AAF990_18575 [Bacteroidota bacterium]